MANKIPTYFMDDPFEDHIWPAQGFSAWPLCDLTSFFDLQRFLIMMVLLLLIYENEDLLRQFLTGLGEPVGLGSFACNSPHPYILSVSEAKPLVNFWPFEPNLIKTFQNQANTPLITKIVLTFFGTFLVDVIQIPPALLDHTTANVIFCHGHMSIQARRKIK